MAKHKEIIVEKDDFSDDIDVGFAASDENLDLIVRELDLVTQFLKRDSVFKNSSNGAGLSIFESNVNGLCPSAIKRGSKRYKGHAPV